jgi:single-strand DNA-binding protein
LRYAPNGSAVANFTVASTPRFFDKQANEWRDSDTLFLRCNVWRQQAEHVAESLQRGNRVVVVGRLKQRSYETREGEKRTVYEIEADDVAVSLKNATAKVTKAQRQGGGAGQPQGGFGQQGPQQGGQQAPQGGNQPADDPWATNQPAGGGGFSDDPPF